MESMINVPNAYQMMEAHIYLNMGIYFTNYFIVEDIGVVTSRMIPDLYWNFAFTGSLVPFNTKQLSLATSQLQSLARKPTVWQLSSFPIPDTWSVQSKEAWLWLDASEWRPPRAQATVDQLVIKDAAVPTAMMRGVFENAYSSGGTPGDIGYFMLPPQYGEAYETGRPEAPTVQRHFSGWLGDTCVAVGTASIWRKIGGIYSVATHRDYRRRGFAKTLSSSATTWAIKHGALGVMLQTEADSPVEIMYKHLGYARTHIGYLLAQDNAT